MKLLVRYTVLDRSGEVAFRYDWRGDDALWDGAKEGETKYLPQEEGTRAAKVIMVVGPIASLEHAAAVVLMQLEDAANNVCAISLLPTE